MPKNRYEKSKVLKPLQLNAAAAETAIPLPPPSTEILDQFVTTGSQTITSETTFLSGSFFMPEPWQMESDFPNDLSEALIEWCLSGRITTDAAPGNLTVRCRLGGTVVVSDVYGEGVSKTANRIHFLGEFTLGPKDGAAGVGTDCNGSILRLAQNNLFTTQIALETDSTVGIAVNYNDINTMTVTLQSSDAGTSIESAHGWMKITYRRPLHVKTRFV